MTLSTNLVMDDFLQTSVCLHTIDQEATAPRHKSTHTMPTGELDRITSDQMVAADNEEEAKYFNYGTCVYHIFHA